MTQRFQLYLLNSMLLFFLLFEPLLGSPNPNLSSFMQYYGYGGSMNQRNLNYQQYEPQYQVDQQESLQPQHQQQSLEQLRYGQRDFLQPRSDSLPLHSTEQDNVKKQTAGGDIDEKLRSIFKFGNEGGTHLFNTTVDSKFNSSVSTQVVTAKDGNDKPTMTLLPLTTSSASSSTAPTNSQEPTFKVQRTPDGKLSLVFNDILSLQRPNVQPTPQPAVLHRRDEIIFPTHSQADTAFNGCDSYEGQSLCSKARNYPKLVQLDTLLQRELSKLDLFFVEELDTLQPKNISQRFGGDVYELDLCESVEKIIYPEAGQTVDSNWMLIVNDGNTYRQGIRIEECKRPGLPCRAIDEFLPTKYKSVCKQSYVYRSLVAITDNGTVTKQQFQIPSCCKCVLHEK